MLVYVLRRVLLSIPVIFVVLFITFTLGFFAPGDPLKIQFDQQQYQTDPVILARLRHLYGLDRPFWIQFGDYIWSLARGDWGESLTQGTEGVWPQVKRTFPVTFQIGAAATLLLVVVGIPMGVVAAVKQNTWIDYWIVSISIAVRSVHIIVLAPMLMIILVLWLDVMDTPVGWKGIFHTNAIMPVTLMAVGPLLVVVRQTRTGVLEVIGENYVRTAQGQGSEGAKGHQRPYDEERTHTRGDVPGPDHERPGHRVAVRGADLCHPRVRGHGDRGLPRARLPCHPGNDHGCRHVDHSRQSGGRPLLRAAGPTSEIWVGANI